MDIARLGDIAGSIEAIFGALVVVAGVIFSPRLWRGLKRLWRTASGFIGGVSLLADMSPLLAALPQTLADTGRKVESLENAMSIRTETHEQLNTRIAQLVDTVKRIDHQVHPNGGKSLNDMVKAMAEGLSEVRASQHVTNNVLRISWDALGNFGVFYADIQGGNTYCSSAYLKWVNRTEAEMRGWGWINSVHIDDRERVSREWESCVEDVRDYAMTYRMLRDDGAIFDVTVSASPLRDMSGVVLMWVGVVRRSLERRQ